MPDPVKRSAKGYWGAGDTGGVLVAIDDLVSENVVAALDDCFENLKVWSCWDVDGNVGLSVVGPEAPLEITETGEVRDIYLKKFNLEDVLMTIPGEHDPEAVLLAAEFIESIAKKLRDSLND